MSVAFSVHRSEGSIRLVETDGTCLTFATEEELRAFLRGFAHRRPLHLGSFVAGLLFGVYAAVVALILRFGGMH